MVFDVEPILPQSVLRNIGDKIYEKRKAAALEVEQIVKHRNSQGSHKQRTSRVIKKLVDEFAHSPQANHRKGGLLCLAAIAVGLGAQNEEFLGEIVPPVLESFVDQDARVRYYGLESLYNIAKVSRGAFNRFFAETFDSLFRLCADSERDVQNASHILDNMIKDIVAECEHFDVEAFIPHLSKFLAIPHGPYKRRFLIEWISLLQSVPDIDLLSYLPDLLEGMFAMLSDSHTEIRTAVSRTLGSFLRQIEENPDAVDLAALNKILVVKAQHDDDATRFTAICWLNTFLAVAADQLLGCFADLIVAVLPGISHENEDIKHAAMACNSRLLQMDLSDKLRTTGLQDVLGAVSNELRSPQEPTRLEALRWVQVLLRHSKQAVLAQWHVLMPNLLDSLTAPSDDVVMQALLVHAEIAKEDKHFPLVLQAILDRFRGEDGPALLRKRGSLVVRGLCSMLGSIKVFSELATILVDDANLSFVSMMIQALNLMLLTAPELADLRAQLHNALHDPEGAALLCTLYKCWCHSACAALSLCLLARAYEHAERVIHSLAELPLGPWLLAQLDRLVMLLEAPVFSSLRLSLLQPARFPHLMRAMYSLLMLCPQSNAFHTLHTRLSSIPTLALLKLDHLNPHDTSQLPTPASSSAKALPPHFGARADSVAPSHALASTASLSYTQSLPHAPAQLNHRARVPLPQQHEEVHANGVSSATQSPSNSGALPHATSSGSAALDGGDAARPAVPPSSAFAEAAASPGAAVQAEPEAVEFAWHDMLLVFKKRQMMHILYREQQHNLQFPWMQAPPETASGQPSTNDMPSTRLTLSPGPLSDDRDALVDGATPRASMAARLGSIDFERMM